jgi:hypothetical protein
MSLTYEAYSESLYNSVKSFFAVPNGTTLSLRILRVIRRGAQVKCFDWDKVGEHDLIGTIFLPLQNWDAGCSRNPKP